MMGTESIEHVPSTALEPVQHTPAPMRPLTFGELVTRLASDEALEQQRRLMAAYDRAVAALVGPNDVQEEAGRQFKKKSAWRKLGRLFQISVEPHSERGGWERDEETGVWHYRHDVTVIGVAPWGQRVVAMGSCSTRESRFYAAGPLCRQCGGRMWDNRSRGGPGDFRCRDCKAELMPGEYSPAELGRVPNPVARAKAEHDCRATACTRATNRAISDLVAAGEVSAEEVEGMAAEGWESGKAQTTRSSSKRSSARSSGRARRGSGGSGATSRSDNRDVAKLTAGIATLLEQLAGLDAERADTARAALEELGDAPTPEQLLSLGGRIRKTIRSLRDPDSTSREAQ